MHIFDITLPLEPGMATYPGDPEVEIAAWTARADGAGSHELLRLGSHTGTHVDAPAHCLDEAATIDALPVELLCGPAYVLDVSAIAGTPDQTSALESMLSRVRARCGRLLLKTSSLGLDDERMQWPGLRVANADALIEHGIRLIGVDQLSIAAVDVELSVHQRLLAAGVVIVEGLALEQVAAGDYYLYCLPLRIAGGDGAPARAILVRGGAHDVHRMETIMATLEEMQAELERLRKENEDLKTKRTGSLKVSEKGAVSVYGSAASPSRCIPSSGSGCWA